ncbi:hypothetical protein Tco_1493138 [Tanacetum coccineum]
MRRLRGQMKILFLLGLLKDERLIKRMNEKGIDSSKSEVIKESKEEVQEESKEEGKYQDEIPEGFDRVLWRDLMVMFNPDDENEFWNSQQDCNIVNWKLHEKKFIPLRKEVLMQMLKLKLESEEDNTMALELIKFVKKILAEVLNSPCFMVKSWLVHDQTVHALASPKANELTIPEQTATGKGTSNPLMADSALTHSIQKALNKEMKEMKDIFEELEVEVHQNVVNRKHDEIERKNILIANDNLIVDCLSKEVFYIAMNSELNVYRFTEMHDAHTVVQARCLELEA